MNVGDVRNLISVVVEDFKRLEDDLFYLEVSYFQKPLLDNKTNQINYKETAKLVEIAKRINIINTKTSQLCNDFCELVDHVDINHIFSLNGTLNETFISFRNFENTLPSAVRILEKVYTVDHWKSVLILFLEEMIKINPDFINKLDKNSEYSSEHHVYFGYTNDNMKTPHLLSNGLFVETALDANFIVMLARKILTDIGFSSESIQFKIIPVSGVRFAKLQENESASSLILNTQQPIISLPGQKTPIHTLSTIPTLTADSKQAAKQVDLDSSYHNLLLGFKNTSDYSSPDMLDLQGMNTSVTITKDLFRKIIREILNYDTHYSDPAITAMKLYAILKKEIVGNGRETLLPYVISNVLSYLKDSNLLGAYGGNEPQKNAYTILDREGLKLCEKSIL